MRIGLSTSVIQRGQTGIARHLLSLLRHWPTTGPEHELHLFVLEEDRPLFEFARSFAQVVPVPERFRPALENIFWHQTKLPSLARKLRLDVLHVPSYRRMLWAKPCGLVATIHDLAPFHLPGKYDWKRMAYARLVVGHLARRQDRIIAVSQYTARDIARFFRVQAKRLRVIYNGLEFERFFPRPRQEAGAVVADRFGLSGPFALYVARLEHPGKNHVRLIQAFDRFKSKTSSDWKLALAGGDWHGAEHIRDAMARSPFRNDIRALGFVSEAELPGLYQAAELFIYPSLFEGFGLPPLEAMACGCPVISSARGSLGEVLGQAAAIAEPDRIEHIEEQLTRLAGDPAAREQLRQAGLVQARRFSWAEAARATWEVYQEARGSWPKAAATSLDPRQESNVTAQPWAR